MTPERWRVVKDVFDAAVQQHDSRGRPTWIGHAATTQSSAPRLTRCLRPTKVRAGSCRCPLRADPGRRRSRRWRVQRRLTAGALSDSV